MPFCPNCGKEVQADVAFCPSCGYNLRQAAAPATPARPMPSVPLEQKSTGVAAVLALVLDIFGLMGIGHIYVGKIGKGIGLLIAGIVLAILAWGSFIIGFVTFGFGFIGALFFSVILFALWIWQTYDAYTLAKQFNRAVQETGRAPW